MMFKYFLVSVVFFAFQESRSFAQTPNFVYLKSNNVNLRNGPGQNYRAISNYTKMFMPFEVVYKVGEWYMVKSHDGNIGWIKSNMIGSKNRYIMIKNDTSACFYYNQEKCNNVVVFLKKGSLGRLKKCSNKKCRILFNGKYGGWVGIDSIFGVSNADVK